jgi:glutamate carboxypeptidase
MQRYRPSLDLISSQRQRMLDRVTAWSSINTGTTNATGNEKLAEILVEPFSRLGGQVRVHPLGSWKTIDREGAWVDLALGKCISILKPSAGHISVLLAIHMDTVYSVDDPFQNVRLGEHGNLIGPGVADAKGGIAVMLTALEALERSDFAGGLGWEVLLNCDEEIGSPLSAPLFAAAATRNQFGLLFEPALPDGALVDRRKGSGTFTVLIKGRSAHAGRDFANGRNAVLQAARLADQLDALNLAHPGVTVNVGSIHGGGPANVVPDRAVCQVNFRTTEFADEAPLKRDVVALVAKVNQTDGFSAELDYRPASPPKMLDDPTARLLDAIFGAGRELGLDLDHRPSGGACDGNRLAAAGLPNIDSLGVRGGHIHSPQEYMVIDSLPERAQLTALLLMKIASGDLNPASFSR